MSRLDRLEAKLARFAIPNLTKVLLVGQAVLLIGILANQEIEGMMAFIPSKVLEGEVWRLVTFIFTPPFSGAGIGLLFTAFALFIFWLTGSALENHLGSVRYNLYILISLVIPVILAIIASMIPGQAGQAVANNAVITGVFLGFAWLYPDYTFLLFFVLPVKVKYLAWISCGFIAIGVLAAFGAGDWFGAMILAATPAGFFAFFGKALFQRIRSGQRTKKRKAEAAVEEAQAFHVCSECGKTDKSHPDLLFRYAQTVRGTVCYCEECGPTSEQPSGERV